MLRNQNRKKADDISQFFLACVGMYFERLDRFFLCLMNVCLFMNCVSIFTLFCILIILHFNNLMQIKTIPLRVNFSQHNYALVYNSNCTSSIFVNLECVNDFEMLEASFIVEIFGQEFLRKCYALLWNILWVITKNQ